MKLFLFASILVVSPLAVLCTTSMSESSLPNSKRTIDVLQKNPLIKRWHCGISGDSCINNRCCCSDFYCGVSDYTGENACISKYGEAEREHDDYNGSGDYNDYDEYDGYEEINDYRYGEDEDIYDDYYK